MPLEQLIIKDRHNKYINLEYRPLLHYAPQVVDTKTY